MPLLGRQNILQRGWCWWMGVFSTPGWGLWSCLIWKPDWKLDPSNPEIDVSTPFQLKSFCFHFKTIDKTGIPTKFWNQLIPLSPSQLRSRPSLPVMAVPDFQERVWGYSHSFVLQKLPVTFTLAEVWAHFFFPTMAAWARSVRADCRPVILLALGGCCIRPSWLQHHDCWGLPRFLAFVAALKW